MNQTGKIKEQEVVFEQLKNREITQKQAAIILELSLRQIKRKVKKYVDAGASSLIHGNCGKASNRKAPVVHESKIIDFLYALRDKIGSYGPTFAQEKLFEISQLQVSIESVRKLMVANGLWVAKLKKPIKHCWRERKHHVGELIQIDGSKHLWINNHYYTLLSYIDDATSRIMHADFVLEEDFESVQIRIPGSATIDVIFLLKTKVTFLNCGNICFLSFFL